MKKIKIGVLLSHNGSTFVALQNAILKEQLSAEIVVVVSNNFDSSGVKKGCEFGIASFIVNTKTDKNPDEKIYELLSEYGCDYVLLSGFMKKISPKIVQNFKVINSHPSLLPKYGGVGMYGRYVHEAVFNAKEKVTGCTFHYVSEEYDEGEIILQKEVEISPNDSVETIEAKVKELEALGVVEVFLNG